MTDDELKGIKFFENYYKSAKSIAKKRFSKFAGFKSRIDIIQKQCKSKKVLDIGSLQHDISVSAVQKNWLFRKINDVADSLLGIDYDQEQVNLAQEKGFNIKYGDVENLEIDDTFDIIVLGEIIEHISNLGNVLQNLKKVMKKDSLIIITTPNPYGLYNIFKILLRGYPVQHPEHTLFLDPCTITELCTLNDLEIDSFYADNDYGNNLLLRKLYLFILKCRPYLSDNFIYIIKKKYS